MYDHDKKYLVGNSVAQAFVDAMPEPQNPPAKLHLATVNDAVKPPQRRRNSDTGITRRDASPLQQLLIRVLDEIDYGVILVDAQGGVCHANHLGRAELESGHTLSLAGRQLVATADSQKQALDAALARASGGTRSLIDINPVGQTEGAMLALIPMGSPKSNSTARGPVLVISGKQQLCEQISLQFFAQQHGLSRSEQAVLHALAHGVSVQDIASNRGLALSTVRSQVKDIRVKARCKSVRELLRKLAALPPVMSSLKRQQATA